MLAAGPAHHLHKIGMGQMKVGPATASAGRAGSWTQPVQGSRAHTSSQLPAPHLLHYRHVHGGGARLVALRAIGACGALQEPGEAQVVVDTAVECGRGWEASRRSPLAGGMPTRIGGHVPGCGVFYFRARIGYLMQCREASVGSTGWDKAAPTLPPLTAVPV